MRHRIQTIAVAALASALTAAGIAVAHGDRGWDDWDGWPWGSASKALTYSETHLQRDGEDVTLRVDQGRVVAASATAVSIQRNDGETVEIPVDEDTRVVGGWWRGHDRDDDDDDDQAKASHRKHERAIGAADLPEGKRVLVARTDDDPAAEWIAAGGGKRHGWHHGRGHDRDRDDDRGHDDDRDHDRDRGHDD